MTFAGLRSSIFLLIMVIIVTITSAFLSERCTSPYKLIRHYIAIIHTLPNWHPGPDVADTINNLTRAPAGEQT